MHDVRPADRGSDGNHSEQYRRADPQLALGRLHRGSPTATSPRSPPRTTPTPLPCWAICPAPAPRVARRRGRWCGGAGSSTGRGPPSRRGGDAFVAISWDEALDMLAAELRRVIDAHGNEAIFGGSYGWASAGRFHHSQSQVHRFLKLLGGYTSLEQQLQPGRPLCSCRTSSAPRRRVPQRDVVGVIAKHTDCSLLRRRAAEEHAVAPGGTAGHGMRAASREARRARHADRALQPAARRRRRRRRTRAGIRSRRHRRGDDARRWRMCWSPGPARPRVPRPLLPRLRALRDYLLGREPTASPKTPEWAARDLRPRRGRSARAGAAHGRGRTMVDGVLVAAARRPRRAAGVGGAGAGGDARPDRPARRRLRLRLRLDERVGSADRMPCRCRRCRRAATRCALHPGGAHHRHAAAARRDVRLQRRDATPIRTSASCTGPAATRSTTTRT